MIVTGDAKIFAAFVKQIPLTRGKVALVSAEDYPHLIQHKWQAYTARGYWYAIRTNRPGDGTRATVWMHRQILNAPDGTSVDHIDHDGLNNTRENLRLCTEQENQRNRQLHRNNTSGFKGAHWHKSNHKWTASIKHNGKRLFLGYCSTAEEAARLYDVKAKELFGEFARLNFPQEG